MDKFNYAGVSLFYILWYFRLPIFFLFMTLLFLRWMKEYPERFPPWAVELGGFIVYPLLVLRPYPQNIFWACPFLMAVLLFEWQRGKKKNTGLEWFLFFLLFAYMLDPNFNMPISFIRMLELSRVTEIIVLSVLMHISCIIALLFLLRSPEGWRYIQWKREKQIGKVTIWGLAILYAGVLVIGLLFARKPLYFIMERIQTEGLAFVLADVFRRFLEIGPMRLLADWGILSPIFQEFYFRGYLFGMMEKRWGFFLATLFSSLLFFIGHFYTGFHIFLFGVLACWAMKASRSLYPPIFLHIIGNSSSLLLPLLLQLL